MLRPRRAMTATICKSNSRGSNQNPDSDLDLDVHFCMRTRGQRDGAQTQIRSRSKLELRFRPGCEWWNPDATRMVRSASPTHAVQMQILIQIPTLIWIWACRRANHMTNCASRSRSKSGCSLKSKTGAECWEPDAL